MLLLESADWQWEAASTTVEYGLFVAEVDLRNGTNRLSMDWKVSPLWEALILEVPSPSGCGPPVFFHVSSKNAGSRSSHVLAAAV